MHRVAGAFLIPCLLAAALPVMSAESRPKDDWLSEDKLLHLVTSAYVTGFSYRVCHDGFHESPDDSRALALSFTALAGVGKELYDMRRPQKSASWKDMAADAAGIALGMLLFTYMD